MAGVQVAVIAMLLLSFSVNANEEVEHTPMGQVEYIEPGNPDAETPAVVFLGSDMAIEFDPDAFMPGCIGLEVGDFIKVWVDDQWMAIRCSRIDPEE